VSATGLRNRPETRERSRIPRDVTRVADFIRVARETEQSEIARFYADQVAQRKFMLDLCLSTSWMEFTWFDGIDLIDRELALLR